MERAIALPESLALQRTQLLVTARQPAAMATGIAPLLIILNIMLMSPLLFLTEMDMLPSRAPMFCIRRRRAPLLSLCMLD